MLAEGGEAQPCVAWAAPILSIGGRRTIPSLPIRVLSFFYSLALFTSFLFFPSTRHGPHRCPHRSAVSPQESLCRGAKYVTRSTLPTSLTSQTPRSSPSVQPPCSRYVLFIGMPVFSCISLSWLGLYIARTHISAVPCLVPSHRTPVLASFVSFFHCQWRYLLTDIDSLDLFLCRPFLRHLDHPPVAQSQPRCPVSYPRPNPGRNPIVHH